jgi:hypothetical protein
LDKLKVGDRIRLFGGYDMKPTWLKGGDGYNARVLSFFDNEIGGRDGDSALSALIEFEEEIESEGFLGKFGFITGRWEGQTWETEGAVHVNICKRKIQTAAEIETLNSCWVNNT